MRLPRPASRHAAIALACLLGAGGVAGAQARRPSRQQQSAPTLYASAWVGFAQAQRVDDGTTQSSWDFGSGAQYRGTLEYAIGNESAIGISASYARLPLVYTNVGTAEGCGACDADATVQTFLALFHIGGRPGFHQVIELGAGATQYRDFKSRDDDRRLAPTSDLDFAFAVAYGFGYGLSPTTALQLVQEYSSAIHQREGLRGNARTNAQQYVTRVGFRFGF